MLTRNLVTLAHTGGALAKYLRVKWSGTALTVAAATERAVGTLADTVLSGDLKATVIPMSIGGARKFVAAGAFSVGADIYGAANGKVDDATGGGEVPIGIALEAASGDGSIVEVLITDELEAAA
jgi:hypothetical protein